MGFLDIFNIRKKGSGVMVINPQNNGYIDMDDLYMRKEALKQVAPLSYVLSRIGSMSSDGIPYVVDRFNNELDNEEYNHIRKLLDNPNPMQDFSQFLKSLEIYIKLYGFCPLYIVRATPASPIISMLPLPPESFRVEGFPDITELSRGIKYGRAYVDIDGTNIELNPDEYAIIHDGLFNVVNGELEFFSPIASLSDHIRNYIGQLKARGSLIINGGGKGIIHGDDTSEFGNLELTPKEKDELNEEFKNKFGLVGQKFQILVTRAKVKWIPLSFDVNQLQLHEEDMACMKDISNAIGINPNLFISDSTFQNQEAVKKSAYQDVIIPDSNRIARALTNILCPEGAKIKIDYSHVPCLQQDFSASALALKNMAIGLETLKNMGLISAKEARIELSKHIDINPDEYESE